jgi:adenosylcobinamide-phosphate synthase
MNFEILLITALLLDGLFGDPRWYPHPVKIIGAAAQGFENIFRKAVTPQRLAGLATTIATLLFSVAVVSALLYVAGIYSVILQNIIAVLLIYSLVAMKDLLVHSRAVYQALSPGNTLEHARVAVGRIVGRDTQHLPSDEVCRACIETVAENMVDGITAPLFWAVFFSLFSGLTPLSGIAMAAVGMTMYKTINTMDSMFGYKNDKYFYFGWAPARLDDVVNYIPARLSGLFVVLTAFITGFDGRNSYRIFCRDRHNHASPNAAHTEAALAGALNLRLGGPSSYFGKMVNKPFIGDRGTPLVPRHILDANSIVLVSSLLCILFVLLVRNICIWLTMAL